MSLKKAAVKHTSVTHRANREDEVLKEGIPLDHSIKHFPQEERPAIVGANVGVTLNMDNYESVRIDCWLSDEVQKGESKEDAFSRVLAIVQKQVQDTAEQYGKG